MKEKEFEYLLEKALKVYSEKEISDTLTKTSNIKFSKRHQKLIKKLFKNNKK